jgi:hypothetical protein
MYIIFEIDILLGRVNFWSRNDMYEYGLFDDTKHIFPLENVLSRVFDRITLFESEQTRGHYINNHYYEEGSSDELTNYTLSRIIENNVITSIEKGSLYRDRLYLLDLTLDIDIIMEHIMLVISNVSLMGNRFKNTFRTEITKKKATLRDYYIDQILN